MRNKRFSILRASLSTMNIKGRRAAAALGLVALVALSTTLVVLAVAASLDSGLELDRNIANDGAPTTDWQGGILNDAAGVCSEKTILPPGFTAADCSPDSITPDPSAWATGSKDYNPISNGGSGWQCSRQNNWGNKLDLVNAYATVYTAGTEQILYFGAELSSNLGTGAFGIWFLQDGGVGCSSTGAAADFTGNHKNGDILLTAESTGQNIGDVSIFLWECPTPATCDNEPNQPTPAGSTAAGDCVANPGSLLAGFCATISQVAIPRPWTPGTELGPGQFLEGAINLSTVAGSSCLGSYVAMTRASRTLGSALHDFAVGNINNCGTINAHKFEDLNANGALDPQEPSLAGWTICIDANSDSSCTSETNTGVTNANGIVTFSALNPGSYRVCETLQDTWINSLGPVCQTVQLGSAGTQNIEFGNYRPASLSGIKFNDPNGNGIKDNGDAGVSGVEIHLFGTTDCNLATAGVVDLDCHSTTAVNTGAYSFSSIKPGTYSLCESIPTGQQQTLPVAGGTGIISCTHPTTGGNGYTVTLTSGQSVTANFDFGNRAIFRLIVITCNDSTNTAIQSTVTLTTTPAQSPATRDTITSTTSLTASALCDDTSAASIAAPTNGTSSSASFGALAPGTYAPSVVIPKPGP